MATPPPPLSSTSPSSSSSIQETSNILYSCCAAVAAHHLNRPVRLLLGRDEDMEWTGKRHPFEGTYKAGFDKDGKITAVDVQVLIAALFLFIH